MIIHIKNKYRQLQEMSSYLWASCNKKKKKSIGKIVCVCQKKKKNHSDVLAIF